MHESYHIEHYVNSADHEKKASVLGPSMLKSIVPLHISWVLGKYFQFLYLKPDITTAEFYMDLFEAFIAVDIPLHKLNKPSVKSFFEQYCKRPVPDESILRIKYVS